MNENSITTLCKDVKKWAEEKKAEDIKVYDVRGRLDYTDYIIICSAIGDLHLKAIAEYILENAKKEKIKIYGSEGVNEGKWALIDLGDVILHIFVKKTRKYYNLEDFIEDFKDIKRKAE